MEQEQVWCDKCTCLMGLSYDDEFDIIGLVCPYCGHKQDIGVAASQRETILHKDDVKGFDDGYHLDVWVMLCQDFGLDPAATDWISFIKGGQ